MLLPLSTVLLVCVAIWWVWIRKGFSTVQNTAFWGMVLVSASALLALAVWIIGTETHGFDHLGRHIAERLVSVGVLTAFIGTILGIIKNRHTGKTWFVPVPVGIAMFLFWTATSGI
jgi:hypothetical protein